MQVHALYHNRTNYVVRAHTPAFPRLLLTSKFCLATQGGGYGNRQVIAVFAGCIPVVVGELVTDIMHCLDSSWDFRKTAMTNNTGDGLIETPSEFASRSSHAHPDMLLLCCLQEAAS